MSGDYTAKDLFENWDQSFSLYELYVHEDGREDLKIIAANRVFADLIGADYGTLPGKLFTDVCPMAIDWLPFYIQTAKTGVGDLHESYNEDLKKYLSVLSFSPKLGQLCILVIDRTKLWQAGQAQLAERLFEVRREVSHFQYYVDAVELQKKTTPYGYRELKRIILENHKKCQSVISEKIWGAFEAWRGEEARVDDFELISFHV